MALSPILAWDLMLVVSACRILISRMPCAKNTASEPAVTCYLLRAITKSQPPQGTSGRLSWKASHAHEQPGYGAHAMPCSHQRIQLNCCSERAGRLPTCVKKKSLPLFFAPVPCSRFTTQVYEGIPRKILNCLKNATIYFAPLFSLLFQRSRSCPASLAFHHGY